MSPHSGDELHWAGGCRRAILSPPPETGWRPEKTHVIDRIRSPRPDGIPSAPRGRLRPERGRNGLGRDALRPDERRRT
jgi:hypothetical protein